MDSGQMEKETAPAVLASEECWFATVLDNVVSTHKGYRVSTILGPNLKCLAVSFAPAESLAVYTAVRRTVALYGAPQRIVTDQIAICGALLVAACSLPDPVLVDWEPASLEQRAVVHDLASIGERLSGSARYTCYTIQAVFDAWRHRFNAALTGEVDAGRTLETGVPRVDWFDMCIEDLQSRAASMAQMTLTSRVPRPQKRTHENESLQDHERGEGVEHPDVASRLVPRARPYKRINISDAVLTELEKSVNSHKA